MHDTPKLLLLWEEVVKGMLQRTESFPKSVRVSVSQRLEGMTLDVYEWLIEARYTKKPQALLQRVNLTLEKLRLFLRLAHERGYLAEKGLGVLIAQIDEAGRMVGGWIKQAKEAL